jgi:hypothetical protein
MLLGKEPRPNVTSLVGWQKSFATGCRVDFQDFFDRCSIAPYPIRIPSKPFDVDEVAKICLDAYRI